MAINFDYRCGILEAADTKTGREWCWYKGDPEVTRTENGELLSSLGKVRTSIPRTKNENFSHLISMGYQ